MDLDSAATPESDKLSAAAIQENKEATYIPWGCSSKDSKELRDKALNKFSSLSARERLFCLAVACSTIYRAKKLEHFVDALRIKVQANPPCILEDHIRREMLAGREDYLMKMEEAMKRGWTAKLVNKSEEGACSNTNFHQPDDQKRKEMLLIEQKATEERFPDFVW